MKQVSEREALKDLSKFLRDMYCWCDYSGSYTGFTVEVSRKTIRNLRRVVDAVLSGEVKLCDGYDSVYAQLHGGRGKLSEYMKSKSKEAMDDGAN